MTQQTAKRRRKQAKMNNAHLSGLGVTRYHQKSAEAAQRQLARVIANERRIAQRGKK